MNDRRTHAGQWLGWAGLLPFAFGALLCWVGSLPVLPFDGPGVMLGYGAAILGFLGGVRWGMALRRGDDAAAELVRSVMPAVLGWAAMLLASRELALATAALLFVGVALLDRLRDPGWPSWYAALRPRLTVAVVVLHALALAALLR